MNADIQNRMNTQITKVQLYNTLFDIGLTACEEETSHTGTLQSSNSFTLLSARNANYRYTVICYDNDSPVFGITVDNIGPVADRIAHLTVEYLSSNEVAINESYYSIPRSMRSEVNAVFTAVYDLIEEAGIAIKDEEETPPNNG